MTASFNLGKCFGLGFFFYLSFFKHVYMHQKIHVCCFVFQNDVRKRTFPFARNLSASATVTSSTAKDQPVSISASQENSQSDTIIDSQSDTTTKSAHAESPQNSQSNTIINSAHSDPKFPKLSTAGIPLATDTTKRSIETISVKENTKQSSTSVSTAGEARDVCTSTETNPVLGEESQEHTSQETTEPT
jgi:hypothetical protein